MKVKRGSKITKKADPYYIELSNAYSQLADFSADPSTQNDPLGEAISQFKIKAAKRRNARAQKAIKQKLAGMSDAAIINTYICRAEDERTAMAKADTTNGKRVTIDAAHIKARKGKPTWLQRGKNVGIALSAAARRLVRRATREENHVKFAARPTTVSFCKEDTAAMVTYDSGADGNYISETDRARAGMPILRVSSKRVGVANGGTSKGKYETELPFKGLSKKAAKADTFDDFPTSLLSVGKVADDGNVSIFTREDVKVYKEHDVLITCKGEAILIGRRDERGRYRIPLMQNRGKWQPRKPSKKAKQVLRQANSVYDLPSIEEAVKWMHAVCGYPVKSTWLKAIRAGNFMGWPLLTERNVSKYYPETEETPKGHMSQTRKNVRSTKSAARRGLETPSTATLQGKKVRDVYMQVYDVRNTVFSDQTGQFPTRSQRGNKYIMVMVEIDSNAILVEPLKSRKDPELTRAYRAMMTRLQRAGIEPTKHILDNEISEAMKNIIKDEYKMTLELVPPGCHRRNAAEVAIRNFKAHFLSVLAGTATDFPASLWDRLLPQAEITINLLRQSNATPNVSAYAHLSGPFDYNKMPLAPMGCAVQVHEKTDKRGTWSYHSVDGWYLATSPEHYRTHRCHIKATKSERFTDTIQFNHKRITRPTVTHADKVMQAIADCAKAIKNISGSKGSDEMQQLVRLTERAINQNPSIAKAMEPTMTTKRRPPSATPNNEDQRQTRSMTEVLQQATQKITQALPRVGKAEPTQPAPRVGKESPPSNNLSMKSKRRRKQRQARAQVSIAAPARNTRSQTAAASKAAAPPAASTRAKAKVGTMPTQSKGAPKSKRVSRLKQPTPIAKRKSTRQTKKASALAATERRYLHKLTGKIERLENEIHQALAVMDAETGKILNYRQLIKNPKYRLPWSRSAANEFGRLANGVGGRIQNPTNTIKFIRRAEIPAARRKDVTYGSFVCSVRPEKKEKNRTRFTVGGDRINYPGEVATPTAEMLVAKLLFNSVISTKGARFMTMDISNFYLMTPLKRPEYIRISLSDIPDEIIIEYKLREKADNKGCVYIQANRGMYGLPQSGLLANELLEERLNKRGYHQSKLVPGLWSHKWRPVQFTLVVDDFGVKYVGEEHAKHLKDTLEENYTVTTEWDGKRYIGIHLDWDYKRRQVHLSMPGYVAKALKQFQHILRDKQDQPFPSTVIKYGARKQYMKTESKAPPVGKEDKKFIQQVCGKFLFLGRAVDSTLLCPISAIASQSANPTEETMQQTLQLLDYIATQEDAVLTYSASDMKLAVHSDASYLSEPKARSRAGGHFFLSNEAPIPPNNGAVLNIAHIIKHVMTSATEAELAALYIMAREAVYIRIVLEELGHKQPPTPLQTDNAMADAVCNGKVQPKRTKAMDMRFYWLRDRQCQEQFRIYWRPGKSNYADYWTKHHPATHHKHTRREFLTPHIVLEMLRMEQNPAAAAA